MEESELERINAILIKREDAYSSLLLKKDGIKEKMRSQSVRSLILQGKANLIIPNLNYIKSIEDELESVDKELAEAKSALDRAKERKQELEREMSNLYE